MGRECIPSRRRGLSDLEQLAGAHAARDQVRRQGQVVAELQRRRVGVARDARFEDPLVLAAPLVEAATPGQRGQSVALARLPQRRDQAQQPA
jgi:hypothetical protein